VNPSVAIGRSGASNSHIFVVNQQVMFIVWTMFCFGLFGFGQFDSHADTHM
jgi:hypothetical protein